MIKGNKRYFSMFGMMVSSINKDLLSLFSKLKEQNRLNTDISHNLDQIKLIKNKIKNQTYQG